MIIRFFDFANYLVKIFIREFAYKLAAFLDAYMIHPKKIRIENINSEYKKIYRKKLRIKLD